MGEIKLLYSLFFHIGISIVNFKMSGFQNQRVAAISDQRIQLVVGMDITGVDNAFSLTFNKERV